ncbi:hypothetical protein BH23BAC1_BH23BAC1_46190 [soil metagenome]
MGARAAFLPYFRAYMNVKRINGFHFISKRKGNRKTPALLEVMYNPVSPSSLAEKGSLNEWLVERYCLFQKAIMGKFIEINIHHLPWDLQHAEADIRINSLTKPVGFTIQEQKPLAHFAKDTKVLIWPLKVVSPQITKNQ